MRVPYQGRFNGYCTKIVSSQQVYQLESGLLT